MKILGLEIGTNLNSVQIDILIQQIMQWIFVMLAGYLMVQGCIKAYIDHKGYKSSILKYRTEHYKLKKLEIEAKDKLEEAKIYYKDKAIKRKKDTQISLFDNIEEEEENDEKTID